MVYLFPANPTLERYTMSIKVLKYGKMLLTSLIYDVSLMAIQLVNSGTIMVFTGSTIIMTTQPNSTFLNGKLNRAKPYPTREQITSFFACMAVQ